MGWVSENEMHTLRRDQSLADGVGTFGQDPCVLNELAENVAEELEDVLGAFRQKLLAYVCSDPGFKQQMIANVIQETIDD